MSHPDYKDIGDIETRTIEECSELIQTLCKIKRFGRDNFHPDDPGKVPNWQAALWEINDVENRIAELKSELMTKHKGKK
jgi:hypothetical protein